MSWNLPRAQDPKSLLHLWNLILRTSLLIIWPKILDIAISRAANFVAFLQNWGINICLTIVWTGHHRLISFSRRLWCQWKWMYWEWREEMQLESEPLRPDSNLVSLTLRPDSNLVRNCQRLWLSLSLCHLPKFNFLKTLSMYLFWSKSHGFVCWEIHVVTKKSPSSH